LTDNEQDGPAGRGPAEPAARSVEDSATGPAGPPPARASSVWADMLLAGPDGAGEPGPGDAGQPPGYSGLHGTLGWPASGLPPSFGQRPAVGERPDFGDAGPPPAPPPYGRHHAVTPQQAGSAHPGQAEPGPPEPGTTASGPAGYGFIAPAAPDVPQPEGWDGPEAAFGPWETYEAAAGQGWTVGYGAAGGQAPATEAPRQYPQRPSWQTASADSLTADVLLPGRHAAPPGWRRALYQVTGGLVRAPQSAADRHRVDLVLRARTPVAAGHHRVAVLSLKGGVGKTTTAVGLGATLASLRGDRIIAVDANPDRGTLCDKLRLETAATVRDLLNEEGHIRRYADVRAYTTQAPSGLEVLSSDRDPTVSVAFSGEDYEDVAQVLGHYYSVCITDCGTGLLHSAMAGVLRLSDQIVLVSSPSVDGARSASATLDWLAAHQYGGLARSAVVVLSTVRPRSRSAVDLGRLEQHFAARCRAVVRVPYDAHLEEGAEVDLAQLSRATAGAYLVLAAEVGDGFAWPRQ
jgi:MinD-like ATPase involved in chromosome partitioning or flagellar assembly